MGQTADAEARFEHLFRSHYRSVAAYAKRRAPADVADDVTAETFLVAWRRLEAIPREPLPWLLGVARHALLNEHRSRRRQQALADKAGSSQGPPAEYIPDAAYAEARVVRNALARLTLAEREVLTLIVWEGLTVSEAARVLGCSAVSARVRLSRARRRLKQWLDHNVTRPTRTRPRGVDIREEAP
jgi:RNA polymerase sigma-70 factor (ECF subfamily)